MGRAEVEVKATAVYCLRLSRLCLFAWGPVSTKVTRRDMWGMVCMFYMIHVRRACDDRIIRAANNKSENGKYTLIARKGRR